MQIKHYHVLLELMRSDTQLDCVSIPRMELRARKYVKICIDIGFLFFIYLENVEKLKQFHAFLIDLSQNN